VSAELHSILMDIQDARERAEAAVDITKRLERRLSALIARDQAKVVRDGAGTHQSQD